MTTIINASPSNGLVSTADGSGVLKVQSNGVTTNAIAWANFSGASGAIRAGYNISSVTISGTGYYTLAFTSAVADANYSVVGIARPTSTGYATLSLMPFRTNAPGSTSPTTSGFTLQTAVQGSTNGTEADYVCIAVFGN